MSCKECSYFKKQLISRIGWSPRHYGSCTIKDDWVNDQNHSKYWKNLFWSATIDISIMVLKQWTMIQNLFIKINLIVKGISHLTEKLISLHFTLLLTNQQVKMMIQYPLCLWLDHRKLTAFFLRIQANSWTPTMISENKNIRYLIKIN